MIAEIFPEGFQRYQSLPVLGPPMDRYAAWLREEQYTWRSTRYELLMAGRAAAYLKRRSVRRLEELTRRQDQPSARYRTRIPVSLLGSLGALYFSSKNVSQFLELVEDIFNEYKVSSNKRLRKFI